MPADPAAAAADPAADAADLALVDVDVYTGDPDRPWARDVAVRDGRIVAVGDLGGAVGPRTEVLPLPGRLVVPGFQDAHVHPPPAGLERLTIDLHDLPGLSAYQDAVARYAREHPDQAWLTGGGWAMEHFSGGTPRREDLDAVAPDRPVFLFNRDVHGAWVNSRALRVAGITAATADPPDGRIERDPATGEPTGTLHEGAAYSFRDRFVPGPDRTAWERAILAAQRHLHGLGITGWQDAWVTPATEAAYASLARSGRLTARVVGALWWDRHRGLEQIPDLLTRREALAGLPGFLPRTVKIMIDGVVENHTAAMIEPYGDGCGGSTGNHGLSYVGAELLDAAVTELDRLGFQVHMHAIGDRAVRMALDAVAAANEHNGRAGSDPHSQRGGHGAPGGHRHQIAHLQVVHPADLPRFAALGVVANCQPFWAQSEPQMTELTIPFLGPERTAQQYPFADLLRTGATLAGGSDWAVTTADPLAEIEVAVRRVDPSRGDEPPFLPGQRLTVEQAVAAFTAGSAYANHDPGGGRIAPGRRADLAVLDRNIFDPELSGRTSLAGVELTVAAGAVVYERGAR